MNCWVECKWLPSEASTDVEYTFAVRAEITLYGDVEGKEYFH